MEIVSDFVLAKDYTIIQQVPFFYYEKYTSFPIPSFSSERKIRTQLEKFIKIISNPYLISKWSRILNKKCQSLTICSVFQKNVT